MSKWLVALAVVAVAAGIYVLWLPKPASSIALSKHSGSGSSASPVSKLGAPPASGSSPSASSEAASATKAAQNTALPTASNRVVALASPASVRGAAVFLPELTNVAPATVIDNMRTTIRLYADRYKGNPVGTNPEITEALKGGNPGKVQFIDLEPGSGLRINGNGELVDAWGAPFFFHQLSATEMEIRSPGPDHILFTEDDQVVK